MKVWISALLFVTMVLVRTGQSVEPALPGEEVIEPEEEMIERALVEPEEEMIEGPQEEDDQGGGGGGLRGRGLAVTSRTIYGYIKDRNGRRIPHVRVTAFDNDPGNDGMMGRAMTNRRGYYEIHYRRGRWDSCPKQWNCWRPDIYIAVSARTYKVSGSYYDGKPLCENVHYGWKRIRQSRTYNDHRVKYAKRIDLIVWPPKKAKKPHCLTGPFCYYFRYIKSSCYGVVEHLVGCSGGHEYNWLSTCIGMTFGSYGLLPYYRGASLRGRELCFKAPLEKGKPCNYDDV